MSFLCLQTHRITSGPEYNTGREGQNNEESSETEAPTTGFLGVRISRTQESWTTNVKKAFAIVNVSEKNGLWPLGTQPSTNVHWSQEYFLCLHSACITAKLAQIWACESTQMGHPFIPFWLCYLARRAHKKVFADLLTRWSRGHSYRRVFCGKIAALYQCVVRSEDGIDEISVAEIKGWQRNKRPPQNGLKNSDWIRQNDSRIWVLDQATEFTIRIMIISHCENSGHRGVKVTENTARAEFIWGDIRKDAREFVQHCLRCIVTRTGDRVRRSLVTALHGQKPSEAEHMDFSYTGPAKDTEIRYVLALKDDLTTYRRLFPHNFPDSGPPVASSGRWIAAFGSMVWLVSDRGPYFISVVM